MFLELKFFEADKFWTVIQLFIIKVLIELNENVFFAVFFIICIILK